MEAKRITLLLIFGVVMSFFGVVGAQDFTQPMAFSHKTHAGTNEIPCEYCHSYARRSSSSGAPAVESCIGCHQVIKGSDQAQKDKIAELTQYWERKIAIPWKKIHDVPDFVHFSHKRHIRVGMDCADCHGDVSQLDQISFNTMINDLSMGWCMTCHTTTQATANGKLIAPTRVTRGGEISKNIPVKTADGQLKASTDCYICHK